jgi:glycosyltransferase involved in cell wall biosynthesis
VNASSTTAILDNGGQARTVNFGPRLEAFGVAVLAPRICSLGEESCGGSEVVLWEDMAILRDAGIPAHVYARAAREGTPVQLVPIHGDVPLITSLEYCGRFLWQERAALILAYNEPALAGWAPDRTIVRFDWNTPLPRYWNWPGWLPRFQAVRYLFPSDSERQLFLRQHARIPARNALVLPNAVDLQLFRPLSGPVDTGGRRRVGFAGQWVPRKGIGELLAAWRVVKSSLPAAELHLAGGAGLWKNAEATRQAEQTAGPVRQMEEQKLLRCVGAVPRSRMPAFWNSLDVAVVPSLYEPFGLVALEAMACGVPVVASAVGGLQEIIVDNESGILVPPGDSAALARALLELLKDEPRRLRLARGARRRAECFSLERRSRDLLTLLAERAEGMHKSA